MCKVESLGKSAPFEPHADRAPSHQTTPEATVIPLADRDWDVEVYPQSIAGHGATGRWSWAIVKRSEYRPRIRYGVSATRDRALYEAGVALGELVSTEL